MKQDKPKLDDLLYRLLLIKNETEERLMLIYHRNTSIDESVNEKGKIVKKTLQIIDVLDVTRTLEAGHTVLETIEISNLSQFKNKITLVSAKDYMTEMVALVTMILSEIQMLSQTNLELGSIISVVKVLLQDNDGNQKPSVNNDKQDDNEGNLILGGTTEPLAHIVFKAIASNGNELEKMMTRTDITRIGGVLKEIILDHVQSDLADEDIVKRLKAEIEFKIIDALPNNIKAGDINLDIGAILDEIKRFQNGSEHNEGIE